MTAYTNCYSYLLLVSPIQRIHSKAVRTIQYSFDVILLVDSRERSRYITGVWGSEWENESCMHDRYEGDRL